jgi:Tfp pilus assembly protein PilO
MRQSSKRIASSLAALGCLVVALVVYFSFVVPLYHEIKAKRVDQASRVAQVENQKAIVAEVKKLIATYQAGGDLQTLVSSALPLDPNLSEALTQIYGIAQANNVNPRAFAITPDPVVQSTTRNAVRQQVLVKEIGSTSIRLDMTGTYQDIKNFLKNVETNIRIFDVKSMTLQPALKPNQNSYTATVVIVAYYQY